MQREERYEFRELSAAFWNWLEHYCPSFKHPHRFLDFCYVSFYRSHSSLSQLSLSLSPSLSLRSIWIFRLSSMTKLSSFIGICRPWSRIRKINLWRSQTCRNHMFTSPSHHIYLSSLSVRISRSQLNSDIYACIRTLPDKFT